MILNARYSGRYKKKHVSDAKVQKFRLARSARSHPLMGFSRVSGRYKSSWTRPYNECYEHKDTLYRQTMNHVSDTHKKMACSQIAIIYSFFSSFWSVCKTFFRRKSTNILARFLRSLDIIFLKFLVSNERDHITSVTNTVMDILYRQTVINQQCIYWDLRRIVCFQRRYKKKLARSLRSLAILYTFSPVSNASSFNKAICIMNILNEPTQGLIVPTKICYLPT